MMKSATKGLVALSAAALSFVGARDTDACTRALYEF
jgi:hypothetical protein